MTMTETEEREWVCGHFDRMMAAPSPAERTAYLLRHPVLLSSGALRLIQAGRSAEPGLRATMLYLDEARAHFWQHPEDYPKGHGPLEALVDELRAGSVDFAEALQRAREPGCSGQLSHSYLRAVLLHWVEELDIDVAFAMHAAELALEAAWAMPLPHLVLDVRRAAAEGFIRLVHGGLMRRPDGRRFARAIDVGQWAVEDAVAAGRPALQGEYLSMLGSMALDAYTARFAPSTAYSAAIAAWLANAIDPMPAPSVGLALARELLEASVDLREPGSDRGRTLKALLEAVVYGAFAGGGSPDPGVVATLAERALAELDSASDQDVIARIRVLRGV
ncbi:MAG: hypothetical protein IPF98_17005 [Gemmatimonadetes bacterium]|nr:hypothetical protein [Gemmatimonadota bacterium]